MKFHVFPFGLSLGQGSFRPAMIFKDRKEKEVLPVWLDPQEVNVLLAGAQARLHLSSTHNASLKIFEAFNVQLKLIYFDEVSGSQQYAKLVAMQEDKEVTVRLRAAEAMSLAVNAGCDFFTNEKVIEQSRTMNLEHLIHMDIPKMSDSDFSGYH